MTTNYILENMNLLWRNIHFIWSNCHLIKITYDFKNWKCIFEWLFNYFDFEFSEYVWLISRFSLCYMIHQILYRMPQSKPTINPRYLIQIHNQIHKCQFPFLSLIIAPAIISSFPKFHLPSTEPTIRRKSPNYSEKSESLLFNYFQWFFSDFFINHFSFLYKSLKLCESIQIHRISLKSYEKVLSLQIWLINFFWFFFSMTTTKYQASVLIPFET